MFKKFIRVFIAICIIGLAVPAVVFAIGRAQANSIAIAYAYHAADCGRGTWTCSEFKLYCSNTGVNRIGADQWDCGVFVTRSTKGAHERCHVMLGIGPFGGLVYGPQITCFNYNSRDHVYS